MARQAISADGDAVRLLVEVHPGARRSGVEGVNPWRGRVVVAVRAPARGGQANAEVVAVVAAALGLRVDRVQITSGARSPRKTLRVDGVTSELVRARLASKG